MARKPGAESNRGAPGTYVALLRGINVGGKNMLPMPELVKLFEQAGCAKVRTYIQSGNVLFSASSALVKKLAAAVPDAIERKRGFRPAVVIRSESEIRKVVSGNPFPEQAKNHKLLHVGFLASKPSTALVHALDPDRSPGDRFSVHGSEIYLSVPGGVLKTRFTGPYFDSTLMTSSTWRNWRTVVTLLELMGERAPKR